MIFFTADSHFRHKAILKFCNRPFKDIREHDQELIRLWNKTVNKDDIIYHLGDFIFGNAKFFAYYINQLNGTIYMLPGNHDMSSWFKFYKKDPNIFAESIEAGKLIIIPPLYELRIQNPYNKNKLEYITLSHYALRVWNKQHYGAWNFFGHSHGKLSAYKNSLDVGVDCWNYKPVSLKQLTEKLLAQ